MPDPFPWLVLLAGLAAGAVNAIAGGGTLLTFPALLAAGLSPVVANTTSTIALWFGIPGSVWSFRHRLREVRAWIWPMGLVSLVGGGVGAWLLLAMPESIFEVAIPWLILLATGLFLFNEPLRRWARAHAGEPEGPSPKALAFQSVVAIYGGYFGAGIGIMMLAGLGILGFRDVNRMNALKNLLGALCNTAATIGFLVSGRYDLPHALILLAGAFPGYFIGAHFAQRIPAKVVRVIVAAIGIGLAAKLLFSS
ncbi:sulfite exporter TauE/SafE family protein [Haloferula sargassicola]|uniref:Probable membrane transporter protein n=1 Tax=Haloferula sargassicola TaxID=490096 RepID=A0ABP9UIQ3_9BACT